MDTKKITLFVFILGGYFNNAIAKYPISRVDKTSDRAVIAIGNSSIKKGDILELFDDDMMRTCKVRVLKVRKKRGLISTKSCKFNILKKHKVADIDIDLELLESDVDEHGSKGRLPSSKLDSSSLIEMERKDYVAGGVLGTVLGLGIGHAVQGRWSSDIGWFFTIAQLLTAYKYVSSVSEYSSCLATDSYSYYSYGGCDGSESGLWALMLLGTRVGEIISVWTPSSEKYKIVKNKSKSSFFAMPILKKGHIGLALGMSF